MTRQSGTEFAHSARLPIALIESFRSPLRFGAASTNLLREIDQTGKNSLLFLTHLNGCAQASSLARPSKVSYQSNHRAVSQRVREQNLKRKIGSKRAPEEKQFKQARPSFEASNRDSHQIKTSRSAFNDHQRAPRERERER